MWLALAPVLVWQGRRTRATTPRLPEAPGARSARAGDGPPLRLLIAGDSAAAGVGIEHQDRALSGRLAALLVPHRTLSWRLVARTGWATADLMAHLRAVEAEAFDVAVLSLGVNDVTSALRVGTWLRHQRELVELLAVRFGVRQIVLTAVPPMQVMHALPQPLRWVLGRRAAHFNQALRAAVRGWPGCRLVGLAPSDLPAHRPGVLAADGFHPGETTCQRWAEALAASILSDLGQDATD